LRGVGDLLRKKEVSSRELVESQLERREAHEPHLNAFITVTRDQALDAAREADRRVNRGESSGPLHGIPLTLKDLLWTRGVRTTSGSKINTDFVPAEDATVVGKLRSAGAVFLGKTNLHEFAYGVSSFNPHYGPARNPWDVERDCGGSSSGSAAALAAGVGYGSVGTDTGGSIRVPSTLCGTVGLKPTYGRVSRYGVTPLSWSLDHVGPMTRSVEDAALLFEILAGRDVKDSSSVARTVEKVSDRLDELPSRLRMGIDTGVFFDRLDPEVKVAVETAIRDLERLGLERVDVALPEAEHLGVCRNVIAFSEASSYHEENIRHRPEDYGENVRELLHLGMFIRATEYLAAQRARREIVRLCREAFERFDVLVCPTAVAPAPKIGENVLSNGEDLRAGLLRLCGPFNALGFPALSLPCGFARSGLPLGLQIVAKPFEEPLLLKVGYAYERSHTWRDHHPHVGSVPPREG
jgi:aspartyl-tRNA(Asn)/glutamyl-tRNA(Gln) amidotransferase subunit A